MDNITKRLDAIYQEIGVTRRNWAGTELEIVDAALEAVYTDERTIEAGLWQGDMLPRAMAALERFIEKRSLKTLPGVVLRETDLTPSAPASIASDSVSTDTAE